jgi:aldose 1-epimerase
MLISKISQQTSMGEVLLVTLENNHGFKLNLCSFGASIYKITYKDDSNNEKLLNLTNENIEDFLSSSSYYGKTIGRVSGRLFGSYFKVLDQTYPLKLTKGQSSMLHGGEKGIPFQNFSLKSEDITDNAAKITFYYYSPDKEEGFPGNLDLFVSYELNNDDQIVIEYNATSDQNTLLNLTNHIYFNLSPDFETIDSHELMLNANQYILFESDFQFKGVASVDQTLFDFREMKSPSLLSNSLKQTKQRGIDTIFLVPKGSNFIAKLEHPRSSIGLNVYSTYPAVVVYTHQYPSKKKLIGVDDDGAYKGITFECEFEPAGVYSDDLNSAILKKNEPYQESIVFQFYRKDI